MLMVWRIVSRAPSCFPPPKKLSISRIARQTYSDRETPFTASKAQVRLLTVQTGAVAVTLHHEVVSSAVVRACHARGVAVLAWTVDEAEIGQWLFRVEIDAIITNDPRPFTLVT